MKTLLSFRTTFAVGLVLTTVFGRASDTGASDTKGKSGYVAHEWGTFTSVQGSDGVQLDWQAQQLSELPKFVYDWSKAGLNRSGLDLIKGRTIAKQRMETPVIYFYANEELTVDVSVQFPQGSITEWFPQAHRIGPGPSILENAAGAAYVARDSRVSWDGIHILPAKDNARLASRIPTDQSGSHYFAARATDSAFLRTGSVPLNGPEHEKFLFYRGVGDFKVPLQVFSSSDRELKLTNTETGRLSHLFVLKVHDRKGVLVQLDGLASGESRSVRLDSELVSHTELMGQIERAMATALVSEGLFPREATAMVDTWKDSWFAEEGVRVLYLLPRAWTDARLPLTLTPAPHELVRVMVGRSEVFTPMLETSLLKSLNAGRQGDQAARLDAAAQLKRLGRFADPALRLTRIHGSTNAASFGYELLSEPRLLSGLP